MIAAGRMGLSEGGVPFAGSPAAIGVHVTAAPRRSGVGAGMHRGFMGDFRRWRSAELDAADHQVPVEPGRGPGYGPGPGAMWRVQRLDRSACQPDPAAPMLLEAARICSADQHRWLVITSVDELFRGQSRPPWESAATAAADGAAVREQ